MFLGLATPPPPPATGGPGGPERPEDGGDVGLRAFGWVLSWLGWTPRGGVPFSLRKALVGLRVVSREAGGVQVAPPGRRRDLSDTPRRPPVDHLFLLLWLLQLPSITIPLSEEPSFLTTFTLAPPQLFHPSFFSAVCVFAVPILFTGIGVGAAGNTAPPPHTVSSAAEAVPAPQKPADKGTKKTGGRAKVAVGRAAMCRGLSHKRDKNGDGMGNSDNHQTR